MIISIVSGLKGTRTLTPFRAADFESTASTNSAMRPNCWRYQTRTDNLTSRVSRVANYTNPQNLFFSYKYIIILKKLRIIF